MIVVLALLTAISAAQERKDTNPPSPPVSEELEEELEALENASARLLELVASQTNAKEDLPEEVAEVVEDLLRVGAPIPDALEDAPEPEDTGKPGKEPTQ